MKQPPQQRSGTPARPGFTLLETLLAIGLMSMIAAVLIGGSSTLLKSTVRSDPEDALRALLQTVRRTAVQKAAILELLPADNADGTGPDFLWGEENVDQDHPRTEERLPKIEGVKVQILAPEELAPTTFGDLRLVDSESGGLQEVTFGRYRMKAYQQTVQNFIQRLREFTTKRGINFFMSPSNMDLQDLLLKQLRKSEVWG